MIQGKDLLRAMPLSPMVVLELPCGRGCFVARAVVRLLADLPGGATLGVVEPELDWYGDDTFGVALSRHHQGTVTVAAAGDGNGFAWRLVGAPGGHVAGGMATTLGDAVRQAELASSACGPGTSPSGPAMT